MTDDPLFLASYVALWVLVVVLSLAVVALLRQVGVLHARVQPLGTHPGGEGPDVGAPAPLPGRFAYAGDGLTLLAFTSPTCEICRELIPSLDALHRQYRDVRLTVVEHGPAEVDVFRAFKVWSTPYVVAVDGRGVVRGRGIANTLEQVEELVASSRAAIGHGAGATAEATGG